MIQLGVPAAFFGSIVSLHPSRTPWTLELLYAALRFAYFVVMRVKHALACRRPQEYSPQVQPIIQTPLHGSLPSGHATEAFMFAYVLAKLLQADGRRPYSDENLVRQLMAQAARIAVNRTVAGVHFPVDSAAGTVLGLTLGNYFVSRCKHDGTYQAWTFDGTQYPAELDFDWSQFVRTRDCVQIPSGDFTRLKDEPKLHRDGHSPILHELWTRAEEEWRPK